MPDGGKLTIEAFNLDVDEAMAATNIDLKVGRYVVLAVSDTGHGIGTGLEKRIEEAADDDAFLMSQLGMEGK